MVSFKRFLEFSVPGWLFIGVLYCFFHIFKASDSSLKFVFLISRHGHRGPITNIYPPDQYQDKVAPYFPEGLGQLTREGKLLMYKAGEAIHERYAEFIGPVYDARVRFTSTGSPRAVMSGLVLAAAMFPPRGHQVWLPSLNWQPVPIFTNTSHFDKHNLVHNLNACPAVEMELTKRKNRLSKKDNPSQYEKLFKYLSIHTGNNVTSLYDVLCIDDFLTCLSSTGYLPEWASKVFPHETVFTRTAYFNSFSFEGNMLQVFAGPVLHEIKEKLIAKENNELDEKWRMWLHSSHDMIIRPLLRSLGVEDSSFISPGDTAIFELHQQAEGSSIVKVFYFEPTKDLSTFKEVEISWCSSPCTLEDFVGAVPSVEPDIWKTFC